MLLMGMKRDINYFCRKDKYMALSKAKIKLIRSLELKKNRKELQLFVAEGPKLIEELMGFFDCTLLVATKEWFSNYSHFNAEEKIIADQEELCKASFLKHPQQVIALFKQPEVSFLPHIISSELCLALDGVQDPGNLGTIVRIADWFGIDHVFCSPDTVDIYNPKTMQATMGGFSRVKVHYTDLTALIKNNPAAPIYGTFLEGDTIYDCNLEQKGLIIMGNEGKGVSDELKALVSQKLYIPNFPAERESAESLNVAIATSIVCSEFRRHKISTNR